MLVSETLDVQEGTAMVPRSIKLSARTLHEPAAITKTLPNRGEWEKRFPHLAHNQETVGSTPALAILNENQKEGR